MALVFASCVVTTLLFNNCSTQLQSPTFLTDSAASSEGEEDLSSPDPTASPPPSPGAPNPLQPPPAPQVPIVSNTNPAWMIGKNLNEWMEIPETKGAGGAALSAFSGFALKESNSELIIGAAGGHLDSSDNRVVSLVLETDRPQWQLRIAPSPYREQNVSHYKDGTPTSRHTYHSTFYVASVNRLFLFGTRGAYGDAHFFPTVDAFDLSTNQWDPPKTWADIPHSASFGTAQVSGNGDVFTMNSLHRFSSSAAFETLKSGRTNGPEVWSSPVTTRIKAHIRFPLAYDKKRNQFFTLQWADGMGYGEQVLSSSRIDLKTGVQSKINIKPGPVLDMFLAEKPRYAGMDYDQINDFFLFYSGIGEAAGRIYKIQPSSESDEWDMSLFATTATTVKLPATPGAGINSSFKYVPRLKGFVTAPTPGQRNLFFIRTAQ